ncbi:MAG: peptide-binding protein [Candidatus Krumholzibacteriota bacterium]|nr:peptide-binding protein [Candidatus Krumholzibacteriota bacterium]
MTPVRYRAVRNFATEYAAPLRFGPGARLRVEERASEWPGWTWCVAEDGVGRWFPAAWLRVEGGAAMLLREYEPVELPVREGEVLTASLEESGWIWATDETGMSGWVPLKVLEPI